MMNVKTGYLIEEYVTGTRHLIVDGNRTISESNPDDGYYTGVFWWEYPDGKTSRRYTRKTAPKWLLKIYETIEKEGWE